MDEVMADADVTVENTGSLAAFRAAIEEILGGGRP
jgi:hypothetical protein